MPKYNITGPDGKKFTINAPEGATEQDALAFIKAKHYDKPVTVKKNDALIDKIKDSPVGGFVRGLRDPIDAGAQLLEAGLQKIGVDTGAIDKAVGLPGADEAYKQSEQDYRQNWRKGKELGLDGGRLAGNVVGTLPIASALAPAAATTLPAMAMQGAKVGATTSLMNPVDSSKGDVLNQKTEQAIGGAVLGGIAPVLVNTVAKGLSSLAQKTKQVFNPETVKTVAGNIQSELGKRGIDFERLSDGVKQSMLNDVHKAINTGKELNFDALAKKASFDRLRMRSTLGQLTGDPMQVTFEKNTAGIAGVGDELSNLFNQQNRQLVDTLPKVSSETLDNGAKVVNALKGIDAQNLSKAKNLYDQALKSGGKNIPLNGKTISHHVDAELGKNLMRESLPGDLRTYLSKIQDKPVTLGDAQSKIHAINAGISKQFDRSDKAASIVKEKLRQHMQKAAQSAGADTAQIFKQADKAFMQRMRLQDQVPALKAAVKDAAPDDFITKHVISSTAKVRDVLALRAQLKSSPEAWDAVKQEVAKHIRDAATNGKADEFAKFSASGFDRALKNIGMPKLRTIFNKEELTLFKDMSVAANAIAQQPAGAAVNNSGTSQAVANLAQRFSGIPYIKELFVQPLGNFFRQGKIEQAMNPNLLKAAQKVKPKQLPPELVRRLTIGSAATAYPLMEGANK